MTEIPTDTELPQKSEPHMGLAMLHLLSFPAVALSFWYVDGARWGHKVLVGIATGMISSAFAISSIGVALVMLIRLALNNFGPRRSNAAIGVWLLAGACYLTVVVMMF